ncbi:MAG: archaemetzincin family Zn-dependent metalloprotease [Thermoleophilia bacterium]
MEATQRNLFLFPFADLDDGLLPLRELASAVAAVFGLDGAVAAALPIPAEAFDRWRHQYAAAVFLTAAARSRVTPIGPPAAVLLGITGLDLFAPRLNFVFGMADAGLAAAVISLCRLRPEFYGEYPDPRLFRQRVLKEAIHELGHIFGRAHCDRPDCIMHFSTSIQDTDRKGPGFCDPCTGRINL